MFLLNGATAIIKCCLYVCCYQNVTNGNKWILYCIVLFNIMTIGWSASFKTNHYFKVCTLTYIHLVCTSCYNRSLFLFTVKLIVTDVFVIFGNKPLIRTIHSNDDGNSADTNKGCTLFLNRHRMSSVQHYNHVW